MPQLLLQPAQANITEVIFRVYTRPAVDPTINGMLIGAFPGLAAVSLNPEECQCYVNGERIALHLGALIRRSRPARPEEYTAAVEDLGLLGHTIQVISRVSARHRRQRMAQIREFQLEQGVP